jgi:hypothetical protein
MELMINDASDYSCEVGGSLSKDVTILVQK